MCAARSARAAAAASRIDPHAHHLLRHRRSPAGGPLPPGAPQGKPGPYGAPPPGAYPPGAAPQQPGMLPPQQQHHQQQHALGAANGFGPPRPAMGMGGPPGAPRPTMGGPPGGAPPQQQQQHLAAGMQNMGLGPPQVRFVFWWSISSGNFGGRELQRALD